MEQWKRKEELQKKAADQRQALQEMQEKRARDKADQIAKLNQTKKQIMGLTFQKTQLQEQKRQEAQKAELLRLQEEEKQLMVLI